MLAQKLYAYFTFFGQSHRRITFAQKPEMPLTQKLDTSYVFHESISPARLSSPHLRETYFDSLTFITTGY